MPGAGPLGASLAAYLTGSWLLNRTLVDHLTGRRGSFSGQGTFLPRAGELHYAEAGQLDWPPHRGPASRRLLFAPGGQWQMAVLFADGRPFHDLDLTAGTCATEHLCGADRYRGEYRITGPGAWSVTWHVTGPVKDLVLETDYRRAGAPDVSPSNVLGTR